VVVTTQNLFSAAEHGLAMVATPEEVVFESTSAGTFVLDVDLDRARELRSHEDTVTSSLTEGAKAGLLTQWQRPELRDRLYGDQPVA
jgi:hypothetical protein